MKSYYKSILVGMSIVLCSLLFMGYTSSESEVGRYQIETINYDIIDLTGNDIARIPHNTIIKIDTKSGRVYEFTKFLTWDDNNEGTFEHFWVDITKD